MQRIILAGCAYYQTANLQNVTANARIQYIYNAAGLSQ
jgi:hypothetical protein